MASLVFIFAFILFSSKVFSQSIGVYIGSSIPYGLYASKDIYNTYSGMALQGKNASILIEDNRKVKKIDPYLQFIHNANEVDEEALIKIYQFNYRTVQVFESWRQNILLAGAKASYFAESFDLFLKGGLGFGWMKTHGYNIYSDSLGVIKFNPLRVNTLVLQAGIGANIYIKQHVALCVGYDLLYAKNNFGYEKYSNLNGPIPAALKVEVKPDFMVGNFYTGLKFNIGSSRRK